MTLGLPDQVRGCLFDLDGVLTKTATVHAAAWKETFDTFLRSRPPFVPFDQVKDYERYVDGKPRLDGVRSFLASRGIHLPEGQSKDPLDAETINGLGNRKNAHLNQILKRDGVAVFDGSVRYVRAVRAAGLHTAVVSSSSNCQQVLEAAHIEDLFDARIDGVVAKAQHLHGKPAPDTYLAGARALGLDASLNAVFEDALAGVEAGRAGHFGCVIGVDRLGQAQALREHGATVVVRDLGELLERP